MTITLKAVFLVFGATLALSGCQATTTPIGGDAAAAPTAATQSTTQSAVSAFVAACVRTSSNPDAAGPTLESLGFKSAGASRTGTRYTSSFATAEVSRDTRTDRSGQCVVTPKSGSFSAVVALLNQKIASSGIPAMKIGGEEGWLLGDTGSVVLVSRSGGAMTRTQPGVFR